MKNLEESKQINEIINYIIDSMLNLFEEKKIEEVNFDYDIEDLIDFDFFDNNLKFYSNLINLFEQIPHNYFNLDKIQPVINQRNFIIFLNFLKRIIQINKNAYQNPIIKLNISLIIFYFEKKKGIEIINSQEYFYICIKEIEKIFKIKCDEINTIFDNKWINEYNKIISSFKKTQKMNIKKAIKDIQSYYIKKNDYINFDETSKILEILKENNNNIDIESIINNIKYKKHFDLYLEIIANENGYNKNNTKISEYELVIQLIKKKIFEFKDIFYLTNLNDILYLISVRPLYDSFKIFDNISDMYKEFKLNNELLLNESKNDLTTELNNILQDNNFYKKFKKILESKAVKYYLMNKRKFKDNNDSIIIDKSTDDFDDDLSNGYINFMSFYNKNKDCFKKLIIFKYLPNFRRAFVDPNMRIILNPLFIKLSDLLNENEEKKKEILESYLILILIHEIVHLLKFMNENNFSRYKIPQTPNNKEGGKMFINYLFGIPVINSISYSQAKDINNEKNWENITILNNIFNSIKSENKEIDIESSSYKINFFLSNINEENETENDSWYDIN